MHETKRGERELGRFGMGLKTAAFSLGRRLSVLSKKIIIMWKDVGI